MKILFVSPYPPARDGIGDYTAALVGAIQAAGHEARVIAARHAADAPSEVLGVLPRTASARRALKRAVTDWRPDVVHVQFAIAAYGAGTLGIPRLLRDLRDLGLPIVLTLHEVTRDVASLRSVGRELYRRVIADGDVIVVHAAAARPTVDALDGRPGTPVEVIPHPRAELPAAASSVGQRRAALALVGADVVLAFGFIHVDKALDDLIRALSPLLAQPGRERVRLLVAGTVRPRSGPFRIFEVRDRLHLRRVKRMIASANLHDRVVFSGYVARGDVAPTFELADVVVLPYRRIEDSGVANLAAAAGARIVATDVGNLRRYVTDPLWLVAPADPGALAAAIGAALDADATGGLEELPGAAFSEVLAQTLTLYERTAPTSSAGTVS